ncbi:MAG: ferrochelatase [Planctomycetota bacterium]
MHGISKTCCVPLLPRQASPHALFCRGARQDPETVFRGSSAVRGTSYDAVLIVSFGGPEGPADVLPFLDRVLRGRNVPQERKLAVADRYYRFGGVSPINQQNRELAEAIRIELDQAGLGLPVYCGNRNWHPMLVDTLRRMRRDGVQHSLAFLTSAYSSHSTCRQYLDAITAARGAVGADAPRVSKLRTYFNHPRFVEAWCDRTRTALERLGDHPLSELHILFTAHSLPVAMAEQSRYVRQLNELAELIVSRLELEAVPWQLVYQSRSGPPHQQWLEPDVCQAIAELGESGQAARVLLVPLGFLSDHMEVLYDLDIEAAAAARQAGIELVRAKTLGTHPRLIAMIRELVEERVRPLAERPVVGRMGPAPDDCPGVCSACTLPPRRPDVENPG